MTPEGSQLVEVAVNVDPPLSWTPTPVKGFTVRLWSINRWLRWTGFRLIVVCEAPEDWTWVATQIGFRFWGWRGWSEGYSL